MYIKSKLEPWIYDECKPISDTKRLQEWLCLKGYLVVIDGIRGPATNAALEEAKKEGIADTLNSPISEVLEAQAITGDSFAGAVIQFAKQHLLQSPREVGGENRGPWVRLYNRGNEGDDWPWCAGFVSFILHQTSNFLVIDTPIPYTYSVSTFKNVALEKNLYLSNRYYIKRDMAPGNLFIYSQAKGDPSHMGIVTEVNANYFKTIEGNTNDDGNRDGYEVCERTRGYKNKSFILF